MFTSIYRPKKLTNFVGNKVIMQPFIEWLLEWDTNKKNKCALISGLCGIGKSLLVELILKKHDYNIINLGLDDNRNKEYMNNVIKPLTKTKKTFDGQENVLVVSDIDSSPDFGFISGLIECIKETKIPIICICDNRYDQSLKPILNYCFDIKMTKPSYQEVYVLIYNIVMNEKIKIKESEIKELYVQSNGDIRFILNALQFGQRKCKKNIDSTNIFETTCKMMSIDETIDNKYDTYWLSNDLHTLMIQENYINNTFGVTEQSRKMENLAYSADALSDADLFETKVNMANWEFEPHVALSTINATSKCNKKMMIKFPQFLGRTATMYKNRRDKLNYEDVSFFGEKPKSKNVKEVKEKKVKEVKEKKVKEVKEKKVKEVKEKKVKEVKEKKVKEVKEKKVKD
jgi:replication factor C subunit 1